MISQSRIGIQKVLDCSSDFFRAGRGPREIEPSAVDPVTASNATLLSGGQAALQSALEEP